MTLMSTVTPSGRRDAPGLGQLGLFLFRDPVQAEGGVVVATATFFLFGTVDGQDARVIAQRMDTGTRSSADHFAYQVNFPVALRAFAKVNDVGKLLIDGQQAHVQRQPEDLVALSFSDQLVEYPTTVRMEGKGGGFVAHTAALQKAQLSIG